MKLIAIIIYFTMLLAIIAMNKSLLYCLQTRSFPRVRVARLAPFNFYESQKHFRTPLSGVGSTPFETLKKAFHSL
jgi:hypothetical protein